MMEREIKDDIICLSMQLLTIHEFNSVFFRFSSFNGFFYTFYLGFYCFFYPFLFFLKGPFSIVASFLQKN